MESSWNFRQRLTLRASTMLYLYAAALYLVFQVIPPNTIENHSIQATMYGLGAAAIGQLVIASIFGLAFFVASLIKRHPQAQYLVEGIAGFCIFIATPVA